MRIIRMNDGTEHEVNQCGAADHVLWIRLVDTMDIALAASEFSLPEKTVRIVNTRTDGHPVEIVYEGYTKLIHIQLDSGILLALRKEGSE